MLFTGSTAYDLILSIISIGLVLLINNKLLYKIDDLDTNDMFKYMLKSLSIFILYILFMVLFSSILNYIIN